MPVTTNECALGEMLAVLLARDMADGEKAIVGTNSDIQVAACNLARQRQAPHLWWVSGPGGMTNPTEGVIRPAADAENIAAAQSVMDLPQMIDFIDCVGAQYPSSFLAAWVNRPYMFAALHFPYGRYLAILFDCVIA